MHNETHKTMSEKSSNSAIGPFSVLFFIFLTLKLTNYIDWSWWWVTAPIWIPIAFMIFVGIAILILEAVSEHF